MRTGTYQVKSAFCQCSPYVKRMHPTLSFHVPDARSYTFSLPLTRLQSIPSRLLWTTLLPQQSGLRTMPSLWALTRTALQWRATALAAISRQL